MASDLAPTRSEGKRGIASPSSPTREVPGSSSKLKALGSDSDHSGPRNVELPALLMVGEIETSNNPVYT